MDDDDVPLFTEETFRRYEARVAAAKATVQAATGMSDDDDDVVHEFGTYYSNADVFRDSLLLQLSKTRIVASARVRNKVVLFIFLTLI